MIVQLKEAIKGIFSASVMILIAKKMQLVYVAVLLTLRGAWSNVVKQDEPLQGDDLIESKCKKATVVDHYTGFYKTFMHTVRCLGTRDKSETEDVCDVLNQDAVRGCLKEVGEVAQRCLEEEERYFPKFLSNSLDNFLDLACSADNLTQLLTRPSATECMEKIPSHNFFDVCSNNRPPGTNNKDIIFEKEKLCDDLDELHDCRKHVLKKTCPENDIVFNILNQVHKAISMTCAGA